jgi:hypothetical protein
MSSTACFALRSGYNFFMAEDKHVRGRSKPTSRPTTPEIRLCRYCKAKFDIDPAFHWKEFCCDSHRKLFWRYGSQSVGKLAERMERNVRKAVGAEVAALCKRIEAMEPELAKAREQGRILEGALATTGLLMRELNQRLEALENENTTQRAIERVLRGGSAVA